MANQLDIADAIKAIQADVTTIVRGEVELAKAELVPQVKSAGIGAGLFGAAGYFGINGLALVFLGHSSAGHRRDVRGGAATPGTHRARG